MFGVGVLEEDEDVDVDGEGEGEGTGENDFVAEDRGGVVLMLTVG